MFGAGAKVCCLTTSKPTFGRMQSVESSGLPAIWGFPGFLAGFCSPGIPPSIINLDPAIQASTLQNDRQLIEHWPPYSRMFPALKTNGSHSSMMAMYREHS